MTRNAEDTIAELPDRLKDTARDFFENWFQYVDPLPETWEFIKELKPGEFRSICFPTLLPGLQNVHRKIIRS